MEVTKNLGLIKPDRIDAYRDFITKAYALNMDKIDETLFNIKQMLDPEGDFSNVKNGIKVIFTNPSALVSCAVSLKKSCTKGNEYYTINDGEPVSITSNNQTVSLSEYSELEKVELFVGADEDGFSTVDMGKVIENIDAILSIRSGTSESLNKILYFPQTFPEQVIKRTTEEPVGARVSKVFWCRQKLQFASSSAYEHGEYLCWVGFENNQLTVPIPIETTFNEQGSCMIFYTVPSFTKLVLNDVILNGALTNTSYHQYNTIGQSCQSLQNLSINNLTANTIQCVLFDNCSNLSNVRIVRNLTFNKVSHIAISPSSPSQPTRRFCNKTSDNPINISVGGNAVLNEVEIAPSCGVNNFYCTGDITIGDFVQFGFVNKISARTLTIKGSTSINMFGENDFIEFDANTVFDGSPMLGYQSKTNQSFTFKSLTLHKVPSVLGGMISINELKIKNDLTIDNKEGYASMLSGLQINLLDIGGDVIIKGRNYSPGFIQGTRLGSNNEFIINIHGDIKATDFGESCSANMITGATFTRANFYGAINFAKGAFMCGTNGTCDAYFYNDDVTFGSSTSVFVSCSGLTVHGIPNGNVQTLAQKANVKFEAL